MVLADVSDALLETEQVTDECIRRKCTLIAVHPPVTAVGAILSEKYEFNWHLISYYYLELKANLTVVPDVIFCIIRQCFKQYTLDQVFLSFNGGKDCTVLLDITINVLKEMYRKDDIASELKIMYIRTGDTFKEIDQFVDEIKKHYGLKMLVFDGNLKAALERLLESDHNLKACLMGTRRTDPYSQHLQFMQCTDSSWPQVMRVSPLLNWSYHQIWTYIQQYNVPYCLLYEKGYTSIGSIHNTQPNPELAFLDPKGDICYLPAWQLKDGSSERAGRNITPKEINGHNGHRNYEED